jgi:antirestriction protein
MHEQIPEQPQLEETQELAPRLRPRVFLASEPDHRAGRVHGLWLRADSDVAALQTAVSHMLFEAPTPDAADYVVVAHEDFAGIELAEHESLSTISMLGRGLVRGGAAYAAWTRSIGVAEATRSDFPSEYLGSWATLDAFAKEFATDIGADAFIATAPSALQRYLSFNHRGLVSDMLLAGEIDTFEDKPGLVHVFLSRKEAP